MNITYYNNIFQNQYHKLLLEDPTPKSKVMKEKFPCLYLRESIIHNLKAPFHTDHFQ